MANGRSLLAMIRCAALSFVLSLILTGCEVADKEVPEAPRVVLTPVTFEEVPGFPGDDPSEVLPAFVESCRRMEAFADDRELGPGGLGGRAADWREPCQRFESLDPGDSDSLQNAVRELFVPVAVSNGGDAAGLITGYYEAELTGSLQPLPPPAVPLYTLPPDLVTVDLGRFDPTLTRKRILGRVADGALVPYYGRSEIDVQGVLAERDLELIWVHDPVDAFFLHIQGSGRVVLDNGQDVRVGYAGSNGLPFTAIGRVMIDEGIVSPDQASAQGIRAWLRANPGRARDIMDRNARYIFFRQIDGEGPIGAFGVALTPGRSLAVDPAFIPLGVPLFLDTTWPGTERPLRRLVVAQDTGSAIKGPVRGDLFWGYGESALEYAGRMKQTVRYFLLLPKNVVRSMSPVS